MKPALQQALADGHGILVARLHPTLRWSIRAARERGELTAVLRGIYAPTSARADFRLRVLALLAADPDAVLLGDSAAVLHGWRTPAPGEAVVAISRRVQGSHAGFQLSRRRLPAEHVVETGLGVRASGPAATALDLALRDGPDAIDDALRRGISLSHLWSALGSCITRGIRALRAILHDSRDQPWSAAERAAQRALRDAGATGWRANVKIRRPDGRVAFADLGFEHLRLAFEIDGYRHHGSHSAFHADRARDLQLRLADWDVVRMAASWVMDHPALFVATVLELARRRAAHLGLPGPPGEARAGPPAGA